MHLKKKKSIRPVLLPLLLAACVGSASHLAAAETLTGIASKVSDGDTFWLMTPQTCHDHSKNCRNGHLTYKIRLAHIDTPESSQPYGRQATVALYRLIHGRPLKVDVQDTDQYGRKVADIHAGSVWVNAELVKTGRAWVFRRYNDDPSLLKLEQTARSSRYGLWALPEHDRIPPWEWRRTHKHSQEQDR